MILKGNLAPEGAVVKVARLRALRTTAARRASSTARRRRFDAVLARPDHAGDVVVIRYEGPQRRPGHARRCWR